MWFCGSGGVELGLGGAFGEEEAEGDGLLKKACGARGLRLNLPFKSIDGHLP